MHTHVSSKFVKLPAAYIFDIYFMFFTFYYFIHIIHIFFAIIFSLYIFRTFL